MSGHADEARGWRGLVAFILIPIGLVAGLASIWLLPALMVASTQPAPAAAPGDWYRGDRPQVTLVTPDPGAPPEPKSEQQAATGQNSSEPIDSDDAAAQPAVAQDGTRKTLAQVMAGDTVLRGGDTGLPVRFVQQRLNTAGISVTESGEYDEGTAQAVTRLQEKFGLNETGRINRYSLDTLLRVTERGPVLPTECADGVVLCIDKTQRVVRLVNDGQVQAVLDARFGALGVSTEEGLFTVYDKRAQDFSTEFGVPMQFSMYFAGGQAVHYSEFFERDGYSGASAGCVNTRDFAATQAVFDQVPKGSKVFIYR